MSTQYDPKVPFHKPSISQSEIDEVVECLKSGWLTTGPRTKTFEKEFCQFVGARHAVGLNSCTAALHLAVDALGLMPGDAVLVPTMTFAATAEVLHYYKAVPVLVDLDIRTLNMDLDSAEERIRQIRNNKTPLSPKTNIVGIMPVHFGGCMLDMVDVKEFATRFGLWIVEDAAHALPARFRKNESSGWQRCGENTADVTCFSFYANKTITTGEGGMAVCESDEIANRIRQLSLHGLTNDAWNRFGGGRWDYQIVKPGYKYNLTDIASAIGIHQLRKADEMRHKRQAVAESYIKHFASVDEISVPENDTNRIHSWHLFPIRLDLEKLSIDRDVFIEQLISKQVGVSVHWRPLHEHPYYLSHYAWQAEGLSKASRVWKQLISLPIFPEMTEEQVHRVTDVVSSICRQHRL